MGGTNILYLCLDACLPIDENDSPYVLMSEVLKREAWCTIEQTRLWNNTRAPYLQQDSRNRANPKVNTKRNTKRKRMLREERTSILPYHNRHTYKWYRKGSIGLVLREQTKLIEMPLADYVLTEKSPL